MSVLLLFPPVAQHPPIIIISTHTYTHITCIPPAILLLYIRIHVCTRLFMCMCMYTLLYTQFFSSISSLRNPQLKCSRIEVMRTDCSHVYINIQLYLLYVCILHRYYYIFAAAVRTYINIIN